MKIMSLFAVGVAVTVPAWSDTINAPQIKQGDVWIYKSTTEKGASGWNQTHDETAVSRVTSSTIYYTVKTSGSTQPAKELFSSLDWSRVRDIEGKETVVNKPLAFPLSTGKTWELKYAEAHPNKQFRSEEWDHKYTVVGLEPIEVPAGRFNALKIEAEGRWTAVLEPTQTVVQGAQTNSDGTSMTTQTDKISDKTVSGRTYKAFWYVPEVRRWVKSVEEYYGSGGVRNERYTGELESFKLTE